MFSNGKNRRRKPKQLEPRKRPHNFNKRPLNGLKNSPSFLTNSTNKTSPTATSNPPTLFYRPNGSLSLIDFGIAGVDNWGETCVGTTGYAPNEQIIGKAVLQSDFFALGRTFVELITAIPPIDFPSDAKNGKIFWREKAKILNFKQPADLLFADLLDDLMQPAPEKRPRNTRTILKRIKVIEKALGKSC